MGKKKNGSSPTLTFCFSLVYIATKNVCKTDNDHLAETLKGGMALIPIVTTSVNYAPSYKPG